ncbi:hypothetical protein [Reichenbachiella agariperforans]|uniref:hypothetical protein n=1 Tax=Reichenbachiella agariperforans TaxID=156994 RepID=UPI001C08A005|nr:hypothetical protein [Reichenbachiella agariperforans]MBU2913867.1 hypothetical protein [Reichenbachiella agariperforans]
MIRVEVIGKIKGTFGLIIVIIIGLMVACEEPDPFPITPHISFEGLQFVEVEREGFPDSLILSFNFEDGDGDLGIRDFETNAPFHDFDFIVDDSGRAVTLNATDVTPPFYQQVPGSSNTTLYSEDDSRPSYSCDDYDTLRINMDRDTYIEQGAPSNFPGSDDYHLDTLFIVKNENRYNMHVSYYWDRGNGFELLDWAYIVNEFGCGESFNGRFPVLDEDNIGTSLQGTIKYAMISNGFIISLRNYPFKLKFYVLDRKLNKSNVVESPVFTIPELISRSSD